MRGSSLVRLVEYCSAAHETWTGELGGPLAFACAKGSGVGGEVVRRFDGWVEWR